MGLVTQTDSIDVKTVFILIVFKIYRTSKSNILSFDHNQESYFVLQISQPPKVAQKWFCIQNLHMGLSFQEKERFENPMLGCREICKINMGPCSYTKSDGTNELLVKFYFIFWHGSLLYHTIGNFKRPPLSLKKICWQVITHRLGTRNKKAFHKAILPTLRHLKILNI